MPASRTTTNKGIAVTFTRSSVKVNSVVYRAISPGGVPVSFYVPNDLVDEMGNPQQFTLIFPQGQNGG